MDHSKLWAMAIDAVFAPSSAVIALIGDHAENERLMLQARALTGRTEEDIRAAVACSPLCFADFVHALQRGIDDTDAHA